MDRIFVQIASYRDIECQHTIADLFAKAEHPERVFIGVCWQADPELDQACFQLQTRPEQIRTLHVHAQETYGVCWARNQAQRLWQGEEYVLMTDSHMRFVHKWDTRYIEELKRCPSTKAILSNNPAAYTPPNKLERHPRATVRAVTPFYGDGIIRGKGLITPLFPDAPLNGVFIAAGNVFARSEIIREVPYDPYMYFNQEEISLAVRFYTHGWDVFSPSEQFCYHYYNEEKTVRPLHWHDNSAASQRYEELAQRRFKHLVRAAFSNDPGALIDIEKYDLGTQRSLASFEELSGIRFKQQQVSNKALDCLFVKNIHYYLPLSQGQRPKLTPIQAGESFPKVTFKHRQNRIPMLQFGEKNTLMLILPRVIKDSENRSNHPYYLEQLKHFLTQPVDPNYDVLVLTPEPVDYTYDFLAQYPFTCKLLQLPTEAYYEHLGWDLFTDPHARLLLLDHNHRIKACHLISPAPEHALHLETLQQEISRYFQPKPKQRVSGHAPVLLIEDVLEAETCDRLIQLWQEGDAFDSGFADKTYNSEEYYHVKCRKDIILHGPEYAEIAREVDRRIQRTIVPEIEKVFFKAITRREPYKIACYEANKGHFAAHRDNSMPSVYHRLFAMSLNLTNDFEGGELTFPEYEGYHYKPKKGSAVIFSAPLLHQAELVTAGTRFVMLSFLYGEPEAEVKYFEDIRAGKPTPFEAWRFY